MSRVIGYRTPRPSAGVFLLVAPVVAVGVDVVAGDGLVVGLGDDGDGGGGDEDEDFGAGVGGADAEMVQAAGVTQREFAAVIDGVAADAEVLAARCLHLDAEAAELSRHIDAITATAAPQLRAVYGVGPDTAATLLSTIGDNPDRIRSDAAFAKLCGVCPLEASSGKTVRHRLNRGGNRDANRALHVILVVRMRRHQPTRDYIARRLAEGKTKNEIMRCVKRYIVREIYHALREPNRTTNELIA
jgi:transposase